MEDNFNDQPNDFDTESVGKVPDDIRDHAIDYLVKTKSGESPISMRGNSSIGRTGNSLTQRIKTQQRNFNEAAPTKEFERGKILKEINDVILKYGFDVRANEGVREALANFINNLHSLSMK